MPFVSEQALFRGLGSGSLLGVSGADYLKTANSKALATVTSQHDHQDKTK